MSHFKKTKKKCWVILKLVRGGTRKLVVSIFVSLKLFLFRNSKGGKSWGS